MQDSIPSKCVTYDGPPPPFHGMDYSDAEKVNRFIKDAALVDIPELDEFVLDQIVTPIEQNFSTQQKFWLLKALYFVPVSRFKWSHPALGDQTIHFDVHTDSFIVLINRVFKAGRRDMLNQINQQTLKP